jgi:hypothetical protein
MSDWYGVTLDVGGSFNVPLEVRNIRMERGRYTPGEEAQEYSFTFTIAANSEEQAAAILKEFRETLAAAIKP